MVIPNKSCLSMLYSKVEDLLQNKNMSKGYCSNIVEPTQGQMQTSHAL